MNVKRCKYQLRRRFESFLPTKDVDFATLPERWPTPVSEVLKLRQEVVGMFWSVLVFKKREPHTETARTFHRPVALEWKK